MVRSRLPVQSRRGFMQAVPVARRRAGAPSRASAGRSDHATSTCSPRCAVILRSVGIDDNEATIGVDPARITAHHRDRSGRSQHCAARDRSHSQLCVGNDPRRGRRL